MRRTLPVIALGIVCAFVTAKVQAQVDPHFSQYYVYPSWLNPALTGAFDGSYRISGIYRSQWGNVTTPFRTGGLAADFTTEKNLNYGVSILHQEAGTGGYQYTTAYANVAYTGVKFGTGDFQRMVFGFQGGVIQRRFDQSKMTYDHQWNAATGYNPGLPGEPLTRTNAGAFDLGAGVLYYDAKPGKKANFYAGFSASHITQPDDKFGASGDAKFPIRYTVHSGIRLALSNEFVITPNFLYLRQGTAEEKMIGAFAQVKAAPVDLLFGANYRFDDAFSPYVGFNYRNMTLGASYDVTTSDLSRLAKGSNSFEISLTFYGRKKVKTPEVEFICPAL